MPRSVLALLECADNCHVLYTGTYLQVIKSSHADLAKALAAVQTELAAKDVALEKKQQECSYLKGSFSGRRMEQSTSKVRLHDPNDCMF